MTNNKSSPLSTPVSNMNSYAKKAAMEQYVASADLKKVARIQWLQSALTVENCEKNNLILQRLDEQQDRINTLVEIVRVLADRQAPLRETHAIRETTGHLHRLRLNAQPKENPMHPWNTRTQRYRASPQLQEILDALPWNQASSKIMGPYSWIYSTHDAEIVQKTVEMLRQVPTKACVIGDYRYWLQGNVDQQFCRHKASMVTLFTPPEAEEEEDDDA